MKACNATMRAVNSIALRQLATATVLKACPSSSAKCLCSERRRRGVTPSRSLKPSNTVGFDALPTLGRAGRAVLTDGLEFFDEGLGNDKALQEPIIEAQPNAAQLEGEGEIHVAELPDVSRLPRSITAFSSGSAPGMHSSPARHSVTRVECELWNGCPPNHSFGGWSTQSIREYEVVAAKCLRAGVELGPYHLGILGVSPQPLGEGRCDCTPAVRRGQGAGSASTLGLGCDGCYKCGHLQSSWAHSCGIYAHQITAWL
ncbi:hypothetical protein BD413DRAFT_231021 [Trametes elegans]|nr:hypothetical protein BD413DRAFT_231021 [Trametes elegans]